MSKVFGDNFSDDVRIDTLVLRTGIVDVRYPWEPHPLFVTTAERDSVTAYRDSLHDLLRVGEQLFERRVIAIAELRAHDVHLITPDGSPGSLVLGSPAKVVRTLSLDEQSKVKSWAEKYVVQSRKYLAR
jgi:hypothetical protein